MNNLLDKEMQVNVRYYRAIDRYRLYYVHIHEMKVDALDVLDNIIKDINTNKYANNIDTLLESYYNPHNMFAHIILPKNRFKYIIKTGKSPDIMRKSIAKIHELKIDELILIYEKYSSLAKLIIKFITTYPYNYKYEL